MQLVVMYTQLSCKVCLVGEAGSLSFGIVLFRIRIDQLLVVDKQLESFCQMLPAFD